MADEIDIANDRMQKDLDARIAAARITTRELGAEFCVLDDCGEPIPMARRKLGYSTCIDCATRLEKKHRR